MLNKLPLFVAVCGALGYAHANDLPYDRIHPTNTEQVLDGKLPYYVKYKSGKVGTLENTVKSLGSKVESHIEDNRVVVTMLTKKQVEKIRKKLELKSGGNDSIEYIEAVPREKLLSTGPDFAPYNIKQLQALNIWDTNRDGYVDDDARTGQGIKVCIIDSGLDGKHDEFRQLIADGKITGDSLVTEDWHDVSGHNHGTHVAGSILAGENNRGVIGVAPKVDSLHIVRYFGAGGGSPLGLVTAIQKCRNAGANVVNMSLGGGGASQANADAFAAAYEQGNANGEPMLMIAAAGNDGNDVASYPASYDTVISVAALHDDEEAVYFSQTAPTKLDPTDQDLIDLKWDTVELAGGGYQVLSTVPDPSGELPTVKLEVEGDDAFGVHIPAGAFISQSPVTGELVYGDDCSTPDNSWNGKIVACKRGEGIVVDKKDPNDPGKAVISAQLEASLTNAQDSGALGVVSYDAIAYQYKPDCDSTGTNICPNDFPVLIGYNSTGKKMLPLMDKGIDATMNIDDGSLECNTGAVGTCSGGYTRMSGTSMASPTVAGAATLLWDLCGGPSEMTNKQLRYLLRYSAKDLVGRQKADTGGGESGSDIIDYGVGHDRVTGWGLPQLSDALLRAEEIGITTCQKPKISISPANVEVCPNTDVTVDVNIDSLTGNDYSMSIDTQNTTATSNFSPVSTQTNSKLTFRDSTQGVYDLLIHADNSAENLAIDFKVHVLPVDLDTPKLKTPIDGDGNTDINGLLTWESVEGASSYTVTISSDSTFTTDVQTFTADKTSFTLSTATLKIAEKYFWKITPVAKCTGGNVQDSVTSSFTVDTKICLTPNAFIKNEDPERTVSVMNINIDNAKKIKDLSLDLNIRAYPVSGIIAELVHTNDKGEEISLNLINKPGIDASSSPYEWGCYKPNLNATLNDKASQYAENTCIDDNPGIAGVLKPNEPLSIFANQSLAGEWTLRTSTVENNALISLFGENQLNKWCIRADVLEPSEDMVSYTNAEVSGKVAFEAADGTNVTDLNNSALDLSADKGVTYSLYSDATAGAFELDASGALPVIKVADKTKLQAAKSPTSVSVIAEDNNGNVASVIVTIDIIGSLNVNQPPTFEDSPYTPKVKYTANNGDIVTQMKIVDPENDTYDVTISSGNGNGLFELVGTDILIKDKTQIDPNSTTPIQLTIEATDSKGNKSEATVTVTFFDSSLLPDQTFCSDDMLGVSIPVSKYSGPTLSEDNVLNIADSGKIKSLTLDVDTSIDTAGDFNIMLENQAGVTVKLADRDAADFCYGKNVKATFSDFAAVKYKDYCDQTTGSYGKSGDLVPFEPLAAFNGEELKGDWKVTVSSNYRENGILNKWCINVKTDSTTGILFSDSFE